MKIAAHTPRQFADAIKALLPPGAAWEWGEGGLGDALLMGTGTELSRVDAASQEVLDRAIDIHRPNYNNWHISAYRRVAEASLAGVAETMPRRSAAIGGHIGDRLWSHAAPQQTFPIPLVTVDHLAGPARIGGRIGDRLWGHRGRYVLLVRYYRSVVDPKVLWDALADFKLAHVYLWFEDISGVGGEVNYGQN